MVELKKKVTLKKKNATSSVGVEHIETQSQTQTKKLVWLLCVLLAVVIIAVFLSLRSGASKAETPDTTTNEVVTSSVLPSDNIAGSTDSTKQDDTVVEDTMVDNTNGGAVQEQVVSSSVNRSTEYIEQMAWAVIRGNYGNNPVRRKKLGEDYLVIQDKVNEFYRKGLVR